MPGIIPLESSNHYSRRRIIGAAAALCGGFVVSGSVHAQDDDDETVQIVSTQLGPVPSTGTVRQGFVDSEPPERQDQRVTRPTALVVTKAQIDAEVEVQQITDGVMQNPTGPWVVSWYEQTAELGEGSNVVMAGHVDYWEVGPAVFFNLRDLVEGDDVTVIGDDQEEFVYTVDWNDTFDLEELTSGKIAELVGPTEDPKLTLITCGGEFDYANGEYLSRMVVRASLVEK
jgi:hypothetical protein